MLLKAIVVVATLCASISSSSPPAGELPRTVLPVQQAESDEGSSVAQNRPPSRPPTRPQGGQGGTRSGGQAGGQAGGQGGRQAAGQGGGAATAERGPGRRFGVAEAPPRTPGAIRIGTYNTLNLFDDKDDPRLSGEFDDIKMTIDPDRAAGLAAAIKALDADILALQEVESEEALRWFVDRWLKDAGYRHIASRDVGNPRGIECAVLSRFPITEVKTFVDANLDDVVRKGEGWAERPKDAPPMGRLRYQRSPLVVNVKVRDDYELTVFSLHHKASAGFDYLREAEALMNVELIRRIEKENPSRNVVLMGDFNAAPWDKSMRVYLEAGMVDAFAARSTDRNRPESRRWRTHESERVLDYILLNRAAFREFVPGSAFVLGTLHPGDDYDYRKDTPPKGYASDHYPIAVELMPKDEK